MVLINKDETKLDSRADLIIDLPLGEVLVNVWNKKNDVKCHKKVLIFFIFNGIVIINKIILVGRLYLWIRKNQ